MTVEEIKEAIVELEDETALSLIESALAGKELDAVDILQKGVMGALKEIGDRFAEGDYYLAELVLGGDLSDQCIAVLEPHLPKSDGPKKGTVVIGAVKGDLHTIGYGLCAKQLELAGYEVHKVGVDVPSLKFIEKAQETNADIIGLSAFLVTTIPFCGEVVTYLNDLNIRDEYKVIIGGAETSQAVADKMGCDGWAPNATECVKLCNQLMGHS